MTGSPEERPSAPLTARLGYLARESERHRIQAARAEAWARAEHDKGEHAWCPDTCPAVQEEERKKETDEAHHD